jgi:hypothetical protein
LAAALRPASGAGLGEAGYGSPRRSVAPMVTMRQAPNAAVLAGVKVQRGAPRQR